ncbi:MULTISPECIES: NADAR family protein [unclassified Amycolatopsis]|uniref:NADAR family protein n=1 Tax=unclassified Amycolatopsis TaxID=2618356 RepID=UPI0028753392|nr:MULTISPECIES: NADAR family protein [unclassified Amycolatopsis]MDS0139332.1 NADAR family protein [Amycolatopsis sp. 505]MDS0144564.1 NADAR family protein [Amycolatopsis sp. CM201R]
MVRQPRSVEELTRALDAGRRFKYVYFWGHRPPRGGGVGAGCFSQWWPAPFEIDEVRYATAEHYMMWRKAKLFGDDEVAAQVLTAVHPKQAKDFGRRVRRFDEETWVAHRYRIVVEGNAAKFAQHPELGRYLAGTGERVLVEASPVDRVWGIGLAADDPSTGNPRTWRGLNLLGFALGEVRAQLGSRSGKPAAR